MVAPEETFILSCLRARWQPEALTVARRISQQPGFAWDQVEALARKGGVVPLLYATTLNAGLLPNTLAERFWLTYFATVRQNWLAITEVQVLLAKMAEAGVTAVLLKGAALAAGVYGKIGLRPMLDVDILVHEEDVATTFRLLQEAGFVCLETPTPEAGAFVPYRKELMFLKVGMGDTSVALELHWHIFWFEFYRDALPMAWVLDSVRPFTLEGNTAQMLGPEAQLLHLCGHLVHHHGDNGDFRLLWLHDIAEVLHLFAKEIAWEELLRRAEVYHLMLPLARIIPLVAAEWDAPVPTAVLAQLAQFTPAPAERQALAQLGELSYTMTRYTLATLRGLPDWRARLHYLWRISFFPPARFMKRRYSIRRTWLLPLYYPYRWLVGLYWAFGRHR